MSYFQGSPLVFPPSYNNLAFSAPNNNHMPYQPVSSLGSPNSTSDSSMNDLMSNFLAYEQMNNYRLMSMFKMSESPQSPNIYPPMMNPKWDIKTEAVHPVKMEQKSEPELEEIVVKKVKINTQGNYKQSSASEAMRLSSLVDQQMQKLPAWTRESVNRIWAQNKQKMSTQSTITNTYKTTQLLKQNVRPLRILAFKYDRKLQDFMYLVEWKERADGMKPNNSFLSKGELLRIDPAMIIAYYEKQVANTFQNFLFEN